MLDTLDLSLTLDETTYNQEIEALMRQLRLLQNQCWDKKLPIVIVLEGWAAAGKGSLLKKMINYMDPRGFDVHPTFSPSIDEQKYPLLWRFWRKLPAKGNLAFFYHSWYTHLLEDRLLQKVSPVKVPHLMRDINAFERQLFDDGVAIAKYWIHLSRKELKHRLKKSANDELKAWRVRPEDWQQEKRYEDYTTLAEEMIIYTSTGSAPWVLVEGDCQRWARVKVLSQLVATITEALDRASTPCPLIVPPPPQEKLLPSEPDFLAKVNLNAKLEADDYKIQLREAQVTLRKLQLRIYQAQIPVLILFEGWDAAGKGGAIKRLTDILDPRSYSVYPFAAPSPEEKQYHYLWRFYRRLPARGNIGIFDRSWYGRVLVERVEKFATEMEWRQSYREINEFESQLISSDYVLIKFFLHLSPKEQLKRFEDRKNDPFKQYKLTEEDWRNREQWSLYDVAINQMIARTSTPSAPWTVVPANDKFYARVQIIQTVISAIQGKLKKLPKS